MQGEPLVGLTSQGARSSSDQRGHKRTPTFKCTHKRLAAWARFPHGRVCILFCKVIPCFAYRDYFCCGLLLVLDFYYISVNICSKQIPKFEKKQEEKMLLICCSLYFARFFKR